MAQEEFIFPAVLGIKVRAHFSEENLHWKMGFKSFTVPLKAITSIGLQKGPKTMGVNTSLLLLKCTPGDGVKAQYHMSFAPGDAQALALLDKLKERASGATDTTQLDWEEAAPQLGVNAKAPWRNIPNARVLWGSMFLFACLIQVTVNRPDSTEMNDEAIMGFYVGTGIILIVGLWLLWTGKKKAKQNNDG